MKRDTANHLAAYKRLPSYSGGELKTEWVEDILLIQDKEERYCVVNKGDCIRTITRRLKDNNIGEIDLYMPSIWTYMLEEMPEPEIEDFLLYLYQAWLENFEHAGENRAIAFEQIQVIMMLAKINYVKTAEIAGTIDLSLTPIVGGAIYRVYEGYDELEKFHEDLGVAMDIFGDELLPSRGTTFEEVNISNPESDPIDTKEEDIFYVYDTEWTLDDVKPVRKKQSRPL